MPFSLLSFLSSASCCSAATDTAPTTTRPSSSTTTAAESSSSLHVTASTASDTSSSSDNPCSAAFSSSDDTSYSLHTLPSLPSVYSLNPPLLLSTSSSSASFLCLAVIPSSHSAALALSPSLRLYSASTTNISIYDLSAPDPHLTASFPSPATAGALKSAALCGGGRLLTAHQDGHIRVWSDRHRLIATLPTAGDRLRRLPLPSSYVAVRRHKRRLWIHHHDAVAAVAAAGELIYSVSWDKTLKIWRSSDLRCLESLTAHDDAVNAVAVAGDGTVYTGSADRRIRVWARGPGEKRHGLVATLDRHKSAVNALALDRTGSVLYSGACDRSILVWEREESADYMVVVGALRGHTRAVLCLACVGDLVFSGSSDRTVRVWRRGGLGEGYSCLGVMEGHESAVKSVAAVRVEAPGEEEEEEEYRVCSGSVDGEVRVWQVRVSSLKRHGSVMLYQRKGNYDGE